MFPPKSFFPHSRSNNNNLVVWMYHATQIGMIISDIMKQNGILWMLNASKIVVVAIQVTSICIKFLVVFHYLIFWFLYVLWLALNLAWPFLLEYSQHSPQACAM